MIGDIDRISPEDIEQLQSWNEKLPKAADCTLHKLVQRQCIIQPTAQAVCSSDGGLTYSELDDLSSRLAQHLRSNGIKQVTVVSLFIRHSFLSAVAILGVIKCGGACISLDAAQPPGRLNQIIHKVKARLALTTSSQSHLTHKIEIQSVMLTRSWLNQLAPTKDFQPSSNTNNAAFLVSTSGSTGIQRQSSMSINHWSPAFSHSSHSMV